MGTRRQQWLKSKFLNPGAFKRSWQNIVKNCLKDIVKYLFQNMTLRGIKPCHQSNRVVFNKIQFVQIAIRTFLVYCPKEFDDSVEVSRWQNIPRYLYDCIILFYSMVSRLYPSINKTVVVWGKRFLRATWLHLILGRHWAASLSTSSDSQIAARQTTQKSVGSPERERGKYRDK